MTDTVVVFPHCAWETFPYESMIERLGRGRSVLFVAGANAMAGLPPPYGTVAPEALDALPWERTTAVVTHPSWVYEIAGRNPAVLLALLPAGLENGEPDYVRCRDALCAMATVVVTGSEPFYFEQWFRRGRVFLQDGLDTAADLLADAAASDAAAGKSVDALAKLQLQRRADFRAEHLPTLRPSSMQYFFQAVYHYLLAQGQEAERWALDAFHLAILTAEEGAVQNYFRFLSVIRLLQGRADDAVATYGISAVTEEERAVYKEMAALRGAGETRLAAALLYRMNDDFRQAAGLLEDVLKEIQAGELGASQDSSASEGGNGAEGRLAEPDAGGADAGGLAAVGRLADPGAGGADAGGLAAEGRLAEPGAGGANEGGLAAEGRLVELRAARNSLRDRAVSLLLDIHERSGRPGAALALLAPPRTVKERLRRHLLEGRAFALEGRRHDAVTALLQAAMTGLEPLHAIADIAAVRAKAKKMAEGEFT